MAFNLYRNQHVAISNNLLKNILDRVEQKNYPSIVVRVPGRLFIIVTPKDYKSKDFAFIYDWLEKGEKLIVLHHNTHQSISEQYGHLKNIFFKNIESKLMKADSGRYFILLPKNNYSKKQLDYQNITQQVLAIPIIQTNLGVI